MKTLDNCFVQRDLSGFSRLLLSKKAKDFKSWKRFCGNC